MVKILKKNILPACIHCRVFIFKLITFCFCKIQILLQREDHYRINLSRKYYLFTFCKIINFIIYITVRKYFHNQEIRNNPRSLKFFIFFLSSITALRSVTTGAFYVIHRIIQNLLGCLRKSRSLKNWKMNYATIFPGTMCNYIIH